MNEFEPIIIMLRMAMEKETIRHNTYITGMVRDAIIVRHHPEKIRSISHVTYKYSVVLGRSNEMSIENMSPSMLTSNDIRQLLDFFISL